MKELAIVVHNVRSAHNVGSIFRTADGFGAQVVLCGYSPHPEIDGDKRLPHEILKTTNQIKKTSLGAENTVEWKHFAKLSDGVNYLKEKGFLVAALEQTSTSAPINEFKTDKPIALIVGNEVKGLETDEIKLADKVVEIPMFGKKESFNVANAAAMALYHLRFSAR